MRTCVRTMLVAATLALLTLTPGCIVLSFGGRHYHCDNDKACGGPEHCDRHQAADAAPAPHAAQPETQPEQ